MDHLLKEELELIQEQQLQIADDLALIKKKLDIKEDEESLDDDIDNDDF